MDKTQIQELFEQFLKSIPVPQDSNRLKKDFFTLQAEGFQYLEKVMTYMADPAHKKETA